MSEGIITRRIKTPTPFLLDKFRNAAAAYSLRALTSSGQDNPVVKVRRSVDDTEQDFNPTEIEDGTLTSFVGGQNLIPNSEQIDVGTWSKNNVTVDPNVETAPDGSLTADKIIPDVGTDLSGNLAYFRRLVLFNLIPAGKSFKISFYAKAAGYNELRCFTNISGPNVTNVFALTSEWQRYEMPVQVSGGNSKVIDFIIRDSNPANGTDGVYVWGVQLEEGTTVGDYVPTTGTLAGDGFVTTWYDQSGNGNDATQATAASQPKIVSAGSLVTENGKPAIDFDGVDDNLVAVPNTSSAKYSFISVKTPKTANQSAGSWFFALNVDNRIFEAFGNTPGVVTNNEIGVYFQPPGDGISQTAPNLEVKKYLTCLFVDASNAEYFVDGASVGALNGTDTTGITAGSQLQIGQRFGNSPTDPSAQYFLELILYPSDQSTNRQQIESNINNYYGIY